MQVGTTEENQSLRALLSRFSLRKLKIFLHSKMIKVYIITDIEYIDIDMICILTDV